MLYEGSVSLRATPNDAIELSIGTLSAATGVPVDTLRTWERRYGFPTPVGRTEGSHRRYAVDTVQTVHLIVEALARGHRPSAVVGKSEEDIRRLLDLGARAATGEAAERESQAIERWLSLTRELDAVTLAKELELCLAGMPVISFLERYIGPYLAEVGERWARGELRISQEHFASERTREFLCARWRALAEASAGDAVNVVLATPPGEHHVLGLHMAAWVIALAGGRIVFLGADTPMSEIGFAVDRHAASAVVLSVAAGYGGDLAAHLEELSGALPPQVPWVIGGSGAVGRTADPGHILNRFSGLAAWCARLGSATVHK